MAMVVAAAVERSLQVFSRKCAKDLVSSPRDLPAFLRPCQTTSPVNPPRAAFTASTSAYRYTNI